MSGLLHAGACVSRNPTQIACPSLPLAQPGWLVENLHDTSECTSTTSLASRWGVQQHQPLGTGWGVQQHQPLGTGQRVGGAATSTSRNRAEGGGCININL